MLSRYLPSRPLPQYTYIPGQTPRPDDDDAESVDVDAERLAADWSDCEEYLYGVDLFNAGFYWEAHEAWEAVWIVAGRRGVLANFLKGLIKLAAAGVKAREGNANGFQRHTARAVQLFESVAASALRCMGLSVDELTQQARQARDLSLPLADNDAARVFPVFSFRLELE